MEHLSDLQLRILARIETAILLIEENGQPAFAVEELKAARKELKDLAREN